MGGLTARAIALPAAAVGTAHLLLQIGSDRAEAMQLLSAAVRPANEQRVDPLARAGVASPRGEVTPADTQADAVVLWAPGQRRLARRWLCSLALQPPQRLVLVGERENGIDPLIADAAELFGCRAVTQSAGGLRSASLTLPHSPQQLPAWAMEDGIRPGSFQTFAVTFGTRTLQLKSLPGVFSCDHLDAGSRLLLEELAALPLPDGPILDLGCGAGVLGIAAALRGADVTFTDINALACAVTRVNLLDLGLDGEVICADGWHGLNGRRFALVISNPPFHHQARQVDLQASAALLDGLAPHLQPDGSALLVANSFLPYERQLAGSFARVEARRTNRQFTVWRAGEARG